MFSLKKGINISGWLVFAVSLLVYIFSAERVGSLWDCGEFILGAYKLQVVHPPGAAVFLLVGRMFTFLAEILSDNPADIAFAMNLMSGLCTATAAMFVSWITIRLSRLYFSEEDDALNTAQKVVLMFAGVAAGLATAFSTSIWFSAVEGEVYAMSTMFTVLTFWAGVKWYTLPDDDMNDRWIVLSLYLGGLSIGVHLLSILTFPALALLYYFKRAKNRNLIGAGLSMLAGIGVFVFVQKVVIVGIPTMWKFFEISMVNDMGMPFHSGLIPTLLIVSGIIYGLLRYAHKNGKHMMQLLTVSAALIIISFSTIGVIVIRANTDTPINMNVPSDANRLLPYLNREQYGERALLYGPHFDAKPYDLKREKRYGRVGDKYEVVDEKYSYIYRPQDKILFPRIGHNDPGRPELHRMWWGKEQGTPTFGYNLKFFVQYQMGWMYWRYFMWNYVGRQNGDQGYFPWDKSSGHWESGLKFIDEGRLYNMDEMPDSLKNNKARNHYYFLPLIFGLIGFFFNASRKKKEFAALFVLFIITGLGIIVYSNQPPNEPRERDYVLVGSFLTFCIWIGMAVPALYEMVRERKWIKSDIVRAGIAGALVILAPIIMGFQNYDDQSRMHHTASRDYASNFLNSVEENAIIFTYGDNDTYPLWYAQEVEGIRTDVRVVNLSLIAVDWYINKLRNKVNDSDPIKFMMEPDQYRGNLRNQVFFSNPEERRPVDIKSAFKAISSDQVIPGYPQNVRGYIPSTKIIIPTNVRAAMDMGMITLADTANIASAIEFDFYKRGNSLTKDELAVLDIIGSNIWERPIYFAITCKNDKLMRVNDYTQMEGLSLRIIPVKTESDKNISIYGSGRVASDILYDNVMNKWKWGNFDKLDLFVDASYAAEIQAMRMAIMRASTDLIANGEVEKGIALTDKYFESFPNMNFEYDDSIYPLIRNYVRTKEFDKAKKHMRILAENAEQWVNFVMSIDPDVKESSFEKQYIFSLRAANNILNDAQRMEDPAFLKEMEDKIGWVLDGIKN
jgi:hypothetical protein